MRELYGNYAGLELLGLQRLTGSTLRLCRPSIVSLLLAGAALSVPLVASSTAYDIAFTGLSNPSDIAAPTGSFTYDSGAQIFSNFSVDWDGIAFDFTASANAPTLGATGCDGESASAAYAFQILNQDVTCGVNPDPAYPDPDYRWAITAIYEPVDNQGDYAWVDTFDIQAIGASGSNVDYLVATSSSEVTGGGFSNNIGVTFREVACAPSPGEPICGIASGGGNEGAGFETTWTVVPASAPEPGTAVLFLAALAGMWLLAGRMRRRGRSAWARTS